MAQQVYTVQELIPKFRELNAIYTTVLQKEKIVYSEQVLVTDFYKAFHDLSFFERALIELMLAADSEKYKVLVNNLQNEIVKNIFFYEAHQHFLNALDIYKACRSYSAFFDQAIQDQLQITKEYSDELSELKKTLDSAEWNGRKEEESILERKISQVKPYYEQERKKLDTLFQQQREAEKEAARFAHNRFADIYTLDKAMLSVLASYASKQDEHKAEKYTDSNRSHHNNVDENKNAEMIYFSMKIIAAVYEVCNGEQFEKTTEPHYYAFFNLRHCETLQIKSGEKTRVYYLLHKMYESLPDETKQHWRSSVFKLLSIDKNAYDSKYREPVSDIPSKKSKQFAKEIDDIFE